MSGTEFRSTGGEQEKNAERTKDSETKANLAFWQKRGRELSEEEVRKAIEAIPEKEGFDFYLVIPKGIKNSEVWQMIKDQITAFAMYDPDDIEMPRTPEQTYAVAAHYSQEPDEDSILEDAKSAEDWEETEDQFMTPLERLVAELRWYEENGTHLDDECVTICPRSRAHKSDRAVDICLQRNKAGDSAELLSSHPANDMQVALGVRRVQLAESKEE